MLTRVMIFGLLFFSSMSQARKFADDEIKNQVQKAFHDPDGIKDDIARLIRALNTPKNRNEAYAAHKILNLVMLRYEDHLSPQIGGETMDIFLNRGFSESAAESLGLDVSNILERMTALSKAMEVFDIIKICNPCMNRDDTRALESDFESLMNDDDNTMILAKIRAEFRKGLKEAIETSERRRKEHKNKDSIESDFNKKLDSIVDSAALAYLYFHASMLAVLTEENNFNSLLDKYAPKTDDPENALQSIKEKLSSLDINNGKKTLSLLAGMLNRINIAMDRFVEQEGDLAASAEPARKRARR